MPEEPKYGLGNKTKDGKEYWWCKEHRSGKGQWVCHKPEDLIKRAVTSSSSGGITKPTSKEEINKKLNLTKDFKAEIMTIKEQIGVQAFL